MRVGGRADSVVTLVRRGSGAQGRVVCTGGTGRSESGEAGL